jgi:hypothetical protein
VTHSLMSLAFHFSPSFSNLENSTRNLDMQELDYNPSKKDLTDARIHHLLAEELKPYRRVSVLVRIESSSVKKSLNFILLVPRSVF